MQNTLLAAFGLAVAAVVAVPASAQMSSSMHHDDHKAPPKARSKGPMIHKDNYGSWNNSWGARPAAPPAFWAKKGDWYRHVRACNVKYRSYNARTDTYRYGKKMVRCKL